MTVFDELKARGLLAQLTDEEEIKELINNGKATFYIGFDPTADSLHVGHFMALCLMKRMQMAGNKPIALIGGGTADHTVTSCPFLCNTTDRPMPQLPPPNIHTFAIAYLSSPDISVCSSAAFFLNR